MLDQRKAEKDRLTQDESKISREKRQAALRNLKVKERLRLKTLADSKNSKEGGNEQSEGEWGEIKSLSKGRTCSWGTGQIKKKGEKADAGQDRYLNCSEEGLRVEEKDNQ